MTTPNKIIPHLGQIFHNSKTILFLHLFFLITIRIGQWIGQGPQIGNSIGDRT